MMDNKYIIATGYSRANLCEHVSKYIENGWYPVGGMVIDFNDGEDGKVYCQPMTVLSPLLKYFNFQIVLGFVETEI